MSRRYNPNRTLNSNRDRLSLTLPGHGVKVREWIERFKAGTIEQKTMGYYYDAYDFEDEDEIPNFNLMTPLQKLHLLSKKRKQGDDLKLELGDINIDDGNNTETTRDTGTQGGDTETEAN